MHAPDTHLARRHVAAQLAYVLARRARGLEDAHAAGLAVRAWQSLRVLNLDNRVRAVGQRRARGHVRHGAACQWRGRAVRSGRAACSSNGEVARAVRKGHCEAVLDGRAERRVGLLRHHVLSQHAPAREAQCRALCRQRRRVRQRC